MPLALGIDLLPSHFEQLLRNKKCSVITNTAAVSINGTPSIYTLAANKEISLTSIMTPEHGFTATAGAGEQVDRSYNEKLNLPIHSLFGAQNKPDKEMLENVDVIIFDLQNLPARCYTYVSTLRLAMEAASEFGKTFIVADRPVPLPSTLDGPMLDNAFASFVGMIPAPLNYGMTTAETALWLKKELGINVDLHVCPMKGYRREVYPPTNWPTWVPPSPAIKSWDSAICYTATVFTEALPQIKCGRFSPLAFQILGFDNMDLSEICALLNSFNIKGATFVPELLQMKDSSNPTRAIRIGITDYTIFKPTTLAVAILHATTLIYGSNYLWDHPSVRPGFFDKLFGTDVVRKSLMDGADFREIADAWLPSYAPFAKARRECLLYNEQKK